MTLILDSGEGGVTTSGVLDECQLYVSPGSWEGSYRPETRPPHTIALDTLYSTKVLHQTPYCSAMLNEHATFTKAHFVCDVFTV